MTISTEELARLRLDAVVAPLTWHMDLVGLRVWNERDGLEGTIVRGESGGLLVWCPTEGDGHIHSLGDEWALDLADASTADRVARWVAGRVGLEVGCTAPTFQSDPDGWSMTTDDGGDMSGMAVWDLQGRGAGAADGRVEGLAGLDPDRDARRLPDGSRFVDRLALTITAVHFGGQR